MLHLDFKQILLYFSYKNAKNINWASQKCWHVVLSIFFILLMLFISVSIYIWNLNRDISNRVILEPQSQIESIQKSNLQEVLERIEEQEKAFNQWLLEKPAVKDPS